MLLVCKIQIYRTQITYLSLRFNPNYTSEGKFSDNKSQLDIPPTSDVIECEWKTNDEHRIGERYIYGDLTVTAWVIDWHCCLGEQCNLWAFWALFFIYITYTFESDRIN